MELQVRSRQEGGRPFPVLVWKAARPMRMVASSPHGGGLGVRRWVVNAQVPASYGRRDPDHHLARLGVSLGLPGRGVGMLTAADVRAVSTVTESEVEASATVGLVGTVNLVVLLPERLSDAALVNAVATATEAKTQALWESGIRGTGTAT